MVPGGRGAGPGGSSSGDVRAGGAAAEHLADFFRCHGRPGTVEREELVVARGQGGVDERVRRRPGLIRHPHSFSRRKHGGSRFLVEPGDCGYVSAAALVLAWQRPAGLVHRLVSSSRSCVNVQTRARRRDETTGETITHGDRECRCSVHSRPITCNARAGGCTCTLHRVIPPQPTTPHTLHAVADRGTYPHCGHDANNSLTATPRIAAVASSGPVPGPQNPLYPAQVTGAHVELVGRLAERQPRTDASPLDPACQANVVG